MTAAVRPAEEMSCADLDAVFGERGARRLEAYPVTEEVTWGEEHPGPLRLYLDAGFTEVHRPSRRRAVVAIDL